MSGRLVLKGRDGLYQVADSTNTSTELIDAATGAWLGPIGAGEVTQSHVIAFAGQETTAGGAAAEAFTVTGALATDLAFVQIVDNGTSNVTALQAVMTANTLTVTFSANPGADTVINYQILRSIA